MASKPEPSVSELVASVPFAWVLYDSPPSTPCKAIPCTALRKGLYDHLRYRIVAPFTIKKASASEPEGSSNAESPSNTDSGSSSNANSSNDTSFSSVVESIAETTLDPVRQLMHDFASRYPTIPKPDITSLTEYLVREKMTLEQLDDITAENIAEALGASWPLSRFLAWKKFVLARTP